MNWTQYRAILATELVMTDANGLAMLDAALPEISGFAEERIYKDSDFDFLGTRTIDATSRTLPGSRQVTIPTELVIIEQVNLITPALAQPGARGATHIPLLRCGVGFIDGVWPMPTAVRAPRAYETYFAIRSQQVVPDPGVNPTPGPGQILIAPTPDGEYVLQIRATFDPTPASATNPNTFLLTYYPSLYFAASMAHAVGALKLNFGAQADNPQQAISWEAQYQLQKVVAVKRAQRQRSWGPGWVTAGPAPLAMIPRFGMMQQAAPPPPGP